MNFHVIFHKIMIQEHIRLHSCHALHCMGPSGHKGLDFVRMKYGRFEFLTVVLMAIQVFWDVTPS